MIPESIKPFEIAVPSSPRREFAGVPKEAVTYLRFEDIAQMCSVFQEAGLDVSSLPEDFLWPGVGDVSIIGAIYSDDLVKPPTPLPGWHVNVLVATE